MEPRRVARGVAGERPEGLRRELRLAEVALGHARTARDDLPDVAVAQALAGGSTMAISCPGKTTPQSTTSFPSVGSLPAAGATACPSVSARTSTVSVRKPCCSGVNVMASVASAIPYDGRNARGSKRAGASVSANSRSTLAWIGSAPQPDTRSDDRSRSSQVLALQALGDEGVREVRRVGDRAAMLVDLVEPEPRPPREARRGQEDARDVREERPHDEPDEAHVVEERQPAHALVDARDRDPGRGS